ncbi:hypothetical protein TWF718_010824 [Orbilia javanica]|uniref:Uncharacterized protein n=1 Tax=Orbilia javanica TaxID=47235 RepID=A0AAN8RCW8_9PEZI
MKHSKKILTHEDYTVGWIAALPLELAAAKMMLDLTHKRLSQGPNDQNTYNLGEIHGHNVAIACLPSGVYGTTSAAIVAAHMLATFPAIRFVLMVGIGGGVPGGKSDIRLGDVVVSKPSGEYGGVIQYDYGKTVEGGKFQRTGSLNKPPNVLLKAVLDLESDKLIRQSQIPEYLSKLHEGCLKPSRFAYCGQNFDELYEAEYDHVGGDTCDKCDRARLVAREVRDSIDPRVHYGLLASGNQVMKHGITRDRLANAQDPQILCFEMEAAGLMDQIPCLVIRGICDYCDSHKNKKWQGYAAATAAAYAKELLQAVSIRQVLGTPKVRDIETVSVSMMALTASILCFLGISGSILARICSVRSDLKITPGVLKDVDAQLPLIADSLEKIAADCEKGSISPEEQRKLLPAVMGCLEQVAALEKLIQDISPASGDSEPPRMRKSFTRFFKTRAISSSLRTLETYKSTLILYLQQRTGVQINRLCTLNEKCEEDTTTVHRDQIRLLSMQCLKPSLGTTHTPNIPGTCEWIWNQSAFIKWNESSLGVERILCVQGINGCGKSVLATYLAKSFKAEGYRVLFFSFSGTDKDRQKLDSLAHTFLWQILQENDDSNALKLAQRLSDDSPLTTSDLFKALAELTRLVIGKVYCIIDGVDECVDECNDPTSGLLYYVHRMVQPENCYVALFGRARALQTAVQSSLKIEITSNLNKEDIKRFTLTRIDECKNWTDESLRNHILEMLLEGSDGMFLWVDLMITELRRCLTKDNLMNKLRHMPHGIENLYRARFLRVLRELSHDDQDLFLVRKVLAFTIASCYSLTVDELWYALALDKESCFQVQDKLLIPLEQKILAVCADLINITNGKIQLVHFSVQEFLTRPKEEWSHIDDQEIEATFRVDIGATQLSLASVCIDYLGTGEYEFPTCESGDIDVSNTGRYPFLEYSSQNAVYYLTRCDWLSNPDIEAKIDAFLESPKIAIWLEYMTIVSMEDSRAAILILSDLEELMGRLKGNYHNFKPYALKLRANLEREVTRREQVFGKADPRTYRLKFIFDRLVFDEDVQYLNKEPALGELDKDEGLTNLMSSIPSPTGNLGPAVVLATAPRETSAVVSHIIKIISSNEIARLPAKLDLLLQLERHLGKIKTLSDPLKLLFELLLRFSGRIAASVLFVIATYYRNLDKYDEALQIYQVALSKVEHGNGLLKFYILEGFGTNLYFQERYIDAEGIYRRGLREIEGLQGGRKVLGREYSRVSLFIRSRLGDVLMAQERYTDAEEIFRRTLQESQKLFGSENQTTLNSAHDVGLSLQSQGRDSEAELFFRQKLEGRQKLFGPENRETLNSINSVGISLHRQGKHSEAERFFRQVLNGRQKVLGYDHLSTLTTTYNVGTELLRQGKYSEAEEIFRPLVEKQQKYLGYEDPATLRSVNSLGVTLENQGQKVESEELYNDALQGWQSGAGIKQPGAICVILNLSYALLDQARYTEAIEIYQLAKDIGEDDLKHILRDVNHRSLHSSLEALGKRLSRLEMENIKKQTSNTK